MSIFLLTYLLVMCEAIGGTIHSFAVFFTFFSVVGTFITGIVFFGFASDANGNDERFEKNWNHYTTKGFRKIVKWLIGLAIVCHMLTALIPTQKNMAIIVGSSGAYMALTSEPAKKLGNKALILLEKKIDNALSSEDNSGQAKEKEESKGESSTQSSGQVQQSGQST